MQVIFRVSEASKKLQSNVEFVTYNELCIKVHLHVNQALVAYGLLNYLRYMKVWTEPLCEKTELLFCMDKKIRTESL